MTPITVPREQLLAMFEDQGGKETLVLVEQVLARLGWQAKETFVEADVVGIMEGINQLAREALSTPQARALVKPDERQHLNALLNALDQHAFPVLREHETRS